MQLQGRIYKDDSGSIILVDGIIASLFYAYDRLAHKSVINETLARTFGLENLKNSRKLFHKVFNLFDGIGRMPDYLASRSMGEDREG